MLNIFNNFKRILLEIVWNARIWHLFVWHCDVLHWKSVLTERLYKFCDPKKWLTFQIILFVIWKIDFYNLLKSPKNMYKRNRGIVSDNEHSYLNERYATSENVFLFRWFTIRRKIHYYFILRMLVFVNAS